MDIPEDIQRRICEALGATRDRVDRFEFASVCLSIGQAWAAERERCIRAAVNVANEGGDVATCLSIAEEIRCPDIETKRAAAIRNPPEQPA